MPALTVTLAGFKLPAKHILHTVGPVYSASRKTECESQLESCYRTTLQLVVDNKLKSVALAGISTGIYGFPLAPATEIALKTVRTFLDEHASEVRRPEDSVEVLYAQCSSPPRFSDIISWTGSYSATLGTRMSNNTKIWL